jgi:HlyD family secretion protein
MDAAPPDLAATLPQIAVRRSLISANQKLGARYPRTIACGAQIAIIALRDQTGAAMIPRLAENPRRISRSPESGKGPAEHERRSRMTILTPAALRQAEPAAPMQTQRARPAKSPKHRFPVGINIPAVIAIAVIGAVAALSIWYLVRGQPLLVQGEADATRFDIAARVDGRVAEIPVARGQNVPANAVLVRIDNPETVAKHAQAVAAKAVADAQLANINAGTRPEIIAARKAALDRAKASVVLAQKTFDRVRQLAADGNAPQSRLDQATDSLHESERAVEQANWAYQQAVNGYTREEHEIAVANVGKALADIKAVQSIIDQMVVYAPVASQVYQCNVEPGEYVSPGVPLVTLIDLDDIWIRFDLREDLVKNLKLGDRFDVHIPALGDRTITVEVRLIATKGEYASWRATRATGDFDLRTFAIRAYPIDKVPELRPGMSAYVERARQ